MHSYDLAAYAERIGYSGRLEPTLETLRGLAKHHVAAIPFENVSVLLGQPVELTPEALEKKLVHDRRGGYCFEQNGLMLGILGQIGFEVRPLAGRVRIEMPRDFTPARTHLFLVVTLDQEEWIFDGGVGGMSLTSPIRYRLGDEQETLHESRRIVHEEGRNFHQAWMGDRWQDVYEFTGEKMPLIDREVGNWWTSTHPASKFATNLFAARSEEHGIRLNLLNDRLTRRRGADVLEQQTLTTPEEVGAVLRTRFGIDVPDDPRLFRRG